MKSQTEAEILRGLGARVAGIRRLKKWTQLQLAERAELPRSYVADIEGARRNPSLRTLVRLASALGVTLRNLFGED